MGTVGVEVGHGDGFFEGGAEAAAGDEADFFFAGEYFHVLAGGAAAFEDEAGEFLFRALGFDFFEDILADVAADFGIVIAFAVLDGEVQSGGDGIDGFGDFVAVEGHARFEAEGVSGSEAGGFDEIVFFAEFGEHFFDGHTRE